MPRASRQPLSKNIRAELRDNFSFLISTLSSSSQIQNFFETFLTDEEKTMLTKRLMLHLMLYGNYEVGEIAAILNMSKETIYKHKIIWDRADEAYRNTIVKIASRKKMREFWNSVEKSLRPLDLILRARTDMKARAKLISGNFDH